MEPDFIDSSHTVMLADGRKLGYAQYGVSDGTPVIYCHGFPGCRYEAALTHVAAQKLGINIIAIDRPGYGQSDFKIDRRISDWPADVEAVTAHLGIDRFAVLGVSGGAPYALACAQQLGQRITRLGLVCPLGSLVLFTSTRGMGWIEKLFIDLMRYVPTIARAIYSYVVGPVMAWQPGLALAILTSVAPPADLKVLRDPTVNSIIQRSIREAFLHGGRAAAWDFYLFVHQWDIDPSAVQTATELWHGEADCTVPIAMGRNYAAQIPHCQSHYLPEQGHFSLPVTKMEEILGVLIS
jgi:pimeloyl-ACP methyl ester carboxylesterase